MDSPHHYTKRKYNFTIFYILILLCVPFIMSEKKVSSAEHGRKHFLYMTGYIKKDIESEKTKTIVEILYSESSTRYALVESDISSGTCQLKLPLQNHFLIKFIKYGHLTKKISVDTHVPEKLSGNYYCEFDYEMFPQVPEVNAAPMLQDPVTNFFFKENGKNFSYDKQAADSINKYIKSLYSEHYAAKKIEKNQALKKSNRRIPVAIE